MRWPEDEHRRISEADELLMSPFREDGVTLGTPTWILVGGGSTVISMRAVIMDRVLAAIRRRATRRQIKSRAASMTKDVVFEPVDGAVNDRIDNAYRAKYLGSAYLEPMITGRARRTTIKIAPREATTDRGARP
jgi:hypothetical protein